MSKNSINDYSSNADLNTDVGGISIAEGMLPSNVNNSLREIMSHTADWVAGTTPLSTINIDGGAIDGVNLGANSAGTVAGTTGSFSSVVSFADGTSSAPSLTNIADTNTGLYFNWKSWNNFAPISNDIFYTSTKQNSSGNVKRTFERKR